MLNKPRLGINSAMIEDILLRVAKVPQTNIKNFDVILQNPFSITIRLVCVQTQLKRLKEIDITNTVFGSNPNKV